MPNTPLVSIVMNCYNGEAYLRESIDTVISQVYQNWELVFWDNQSKDKSAQIVNSYNDARIKYFYAPIHTNLGEARNFALEQCAGEFIAFLDTDDLWEPDKLERQVESMVQNHDVDFCYTNYLYWDVDKNKKTAVFAKKQPSGYIFNALLFRYRIGLLSVLIRKKAIDNMAEKFDPMLRLSEEFDLFMRILISSKAIYLDFISSTYRLHGANCSIQEQGGWRHEVGVVASKLKKVDIDNEYMNGIAFLSALSDFYGARADLVKGEMLSARKKLQSSKFFGFKFFAAYIVTFIPKNIWLALKPLWANGAFR